MRRISLVWMCLSAVCCLATLQLPAQTRTRDPLTEKEVDEMRETADFPSKRIEVMVGFARVRINAIDQLRTDTKIPPDRPKQIHDLLEDFLTLLDEIDDNIDMYGAHKADMRKGLKLLIEADSEFQLKLRQLKEQSPPEEVQQYSFILTNAAEAAKESAENARTTLQEQNELASQKKLNKDWSERKD